MKKTLEIPIPHGGTGTGAVAPVRIAMWSGPRNISTALMRSWGSRSDTFVCDEPLYAHYLDATGLDGHPVPEEVKAHHEKDWRKVVRTLTESVPAGRTVFYQKHMAHHFLSCIDRGWLGLVTNCFLIREPREMLTSLIKLLPAARIEDTGLPQQLEIFEWVRENRGTMPPVLDAKDVLDDPERMLRALCGAVGVDFTEEMLSWAPGPRETDGVWGRHWYDAVYKTTSFRPHQSKPDAVPADLEDLLAQCNGYYARLHPYRLGQ